MQLSKYEIYHENKCHTSHEFPYNTYLCTIPLDFSSVKIHWHEEVEIIVIKKGKGIVCVDLTKYEVCTGDAVFVMSGQLHSISQLDESSMEYENILFKPSMLKTSGKDICWENFISPLLSSSISIYPIIHTSNPANHKFAEYIQDIDKLCDEKNTGYQLAIKGYLYLIIFNLISENASAAKKSQRKQLDKIKTVLSYVEEHYAENISIEDMAHICFCSKSYFMKFFKESVGVSFINYLNEHRLEAASNILLATDANILDVAFACGFCNLSYFTRSFKKKYGVTPGKYRR